MDWNRPGKLIRPNPDWEEDLFQTVVVGPVEEARVKSYINDALEKNLKEECYCYVEESKLKYLTEDEKKRLFKKECTCQTKGKPGTAPLTTLNNGKKIPSLGLGTSLGVDEQGNPLPEEDISIQRAVETAIDAGYRLIDTSSSYNTELQVGRAVKNKIEEGVVRRQDLYIVSKLPNECHAQDVVIAALKESLYKLGLDYLDLYLIHWPIGVHQSGFILSLSGGGRSFHILAAKNLKQPLYRVDVCAGISKTFTVAKRALLKSDGTYDNIDYLETWQAMIEARARSLTKSIGVANFNKHQLDRIISLSKVKPAVLQIELNLSLQQASLVSFCREHNITVMGYAPLGSMVHSSASSDAPPPRVHSPVLLRIADKYHKTSAQIALRYLIEIGVIPIPKSVTRYHLWQNMDVFNFESKKIDLDILKKYDKNYRIFSVPLWKDSPYYPFE